MTWLITGGAGYIGAHAVYSTLSSNRNVVVIDDLSSGISSRLGNDVELIEASILDSVAVNRAFDTYNFSGVLHLAAKKQVQESIERPDFYWEENVGGIKNLLSVMKAHGVKNLVYSSSAAVYGEPDYHPGKLITEQAVCSPINPYGETKLEGEVLSRAMSESDGFKVAALRYFNVAGSSRPELGDQYIVNLIPIVFDALSRNKKPTVFGNSYSTPDGSCIRDYIHVQDLSEAHIAAMDLVENSEAGFTAINIGTGLGASVFDVLAMIEDVTGISINPILGERREGDPAALVADVSFANEILDWKSSRDLRDMVASAWDAWQLSHK
jgi:UDP-glucose 4-epimerase